MAKLGSQQKHNIMNSTDIISKYNQLVELADQLLQQKSQTTAAKFIAPSRLFRIKTLELYQQTWKEFTLPRLELAVKNGQSGLYSLDYLGGVDHKATRLTTYTLPQNMGSTKLMQIEISVYSLFDDMMPHLYIAATEQDWADLVESGNPSVRSEYIRRVEAAIDEAQGAYWAYTSKLFGIEYIPPELQLEQATKGYDLYITALKAQQLLFEAMPHLSVGTYNILAQKVASCYDQSMTGFFGNNVHFIATTIHQKYHLGPWII